MLTNLKNNLKKPIILLMVWFLPLFSYAQGIVTCTNPDGSCGFADLLGATQSFISFLMFTLAPPVAVLLFLWAGWIYLTAGPNPGKTEKAKSIFGAVIIGLIIMFSAWLVVNFITDSLLKEAFKTDVNITN